MIKAEWGIDYDWRTDKCYKAVMHNECDAPIVSVGNGKYKCVGCCEEAKLSLLQKLWVLRRTGMKIKTEKCLFCHKKEMRVVYHRNHKTCKWEAGFGECNYCNTKFIV